VDSVDALGTAISTAKGHEGSGVVLLTEAFYTAANETGTAIVIDADADRNTKPYTIRGLGKESDTALTVAVLLANDNVTLENVKIAVTTNTNAASSTWVNGSSYRSALFIGRAGTANGSSTALLTGADAASQHVTVRNCDITATGLTNFTAGVYVWGTAKTDALVAAYPATNITIDKNTITATGTGGAATQGINIHIWDPTVVITNNTITARYGTFRTVLPYEDAPASAIFVNRVYDTKTPNNSVSPTISGNTLNADVYSFFINALSDNITAKAQDTTAGIASFRAKKFANAGTTWATDASDNTVYRKLFDALKADVDGNGFAYVATILTLSGLNGGFFVEQYEITNGQIVAISVLGGHISGDAYTYDTSGATNTFVNSDGPKGYDYGRIEVTNGTPSTDYTDSAKNHFCHGLNSEGSYVYETDYVRAGGSDGKAAYPNGTDSSS
jgi:hypothetical protein